MKAIVTVASRWGVAAVLLCVLSACAAPLLMGAQSQLMWALLKPLVGFEPRAVSLFEQPLIKDRLTALVGEQHYQQTVALLYTAEQISQQGPLFYVLSKAPLTAPLADKAAMVWNADTNQMAVLLVQQGKTQVLAEPLASAATETVQAEAGSTTATAAVAQAAAQVLWPQAMGSWLGQALPQDAGKLLPEAFNGVTDLTQPM
ncbi:hypothetical protein [Balneatrix alpica]|uniref:hypothetical protein n=1 Tax=Balneatrix alpica TaxID=75684 RepID=UPI00273932B4|nr:hypothetical protein [Balneatrix alpica]